VGDTRHGCAVLAAMAMLFVILVAVCSRNEHLSSRSARSSSTSRGARRVAPRAQFTWHPWSTECWTASPGTSARSSAGLGYRLRVDEKRSCSW